MNKALLLGLILACAGLVHHAAATCTTDALCVTAGAGTACNLAGTADQLCFACGTTGSGTSGYGAAQTTAGTTHCIECTYQSTANVYKCTECHDGYFGSAGTAAAITTCTDCSDTTAGGWYGCASCDGVFVDTTTDTATCAYTYTDDTGAGDESSVDTFATWVGWYAFEGATYPCNTLPGCYTCVNNDEATAENCLSSFDGWSFDEDGLEDPVECDDPYCDECAVGEETTGCTDWDWDDATWLYGTSQLISPWEISSYADSFDYWGGAYTFGIECEGDTTFPGFSLSGVCIPCDDASLGSDSASECEWDNFQGVLRTTECKDGYYELWIEDDGNYNSYYTCIECGEGAVSCDLDDDDETPIDLVCDTDNGYAYVDDDDACVSWLDDDEFATAGTWNSAGTTFTATECESGYYINADDVCTVCPTALTNAVECELDGSDVLATECDDGYYVDGDDECSACPDGASTCTSTTVSECFDGYYQTGANACSEFDAGDWPNCLQVYQDDQYGDPTGCDECEDGYGYDFWDNCVACEDNVLYCVVISDTETWAAECDDGYYLYNGGCVAYPEGCTDIYQTGPFRSKIACTECDDGYYLDWTTHACTTCGTGITKCDVQGGRAWPTECDSGYTLEAASYDTTTLTFTFPACSSGSDGGDGGESTTCSSAASLAFSSIAVVIALFVALF